MSTDIKPGQVWAWQDTDFARGPHGFQFEIAAAAPHAPDVAYRYPDAAGFNPDQIYGAPAAVIRAHATLVTDATPAPLDPSKVKAGDTVTVNVDGGEERPESTTTGEVWSDYRDTPHGPVLRVGTVYLGSPMVRLTAHQPAPEPEPEPEPEWKPGTFGTANVRGEARQGFIENGTYHRGFRFYNRGGTDMISVPADFRPLVVIDPAMLRAEPLADVVHEVLAGPEYQCSHAAMAVAESVEAYLAKLGIEATR